MFKKFYILHFTFYIIITPLLLVILSCTTSTDVSKGSLIGSVALENETDYSGISVSLYELAYLDTTIVRINNEYPHIGIKISQHTEFDHRMQTPIKTGTTAADGSFELKNIPTGTYNFVAQKAGYGFRYIYEISISEGENLLSEELKIKNVKSKMKKPVISTGMEKSNSSRGTLSNNSKLRIQNSTLTLFPELHLSGEISEEIIVEPYHHLVCDDDVTFVPGSRLEIQPNAVVRIAPGADLTIMGNFKAQGEEDNMFWVTSNDGFYAEVKSEKGEVKSGSISHFTFPISRESIELYNSMQLSPLATVENDVIEWGKWDWGFNGLLYNNNTVHINNSLFKFLNCGLDIQSQDILLLTNIIFNNCSGEQNGSVFVNFSRGVDINNNIFFNNENSIKLTEVENSNIKNNYFIDGSKAIWNLSNSETIFEHNNINNFCGVYNVCSKITIKYNNFNCVRGIQDRRVYGYYGNSELTINRNNFNCPTWNIYSNGWYSGSEEIYHNAKYNFWGTTNLDEISDKIWDRLDEDPQNPDYFRLLAIFNYIPILNAQEPEAGIENN